MAFPVELLRTDEEKAKFDQLLEQMMASIAQTEGPGAAVEAAGQMGQPVAA